MDIYVLYQRVLCAACLAGFGALALALAARAIGPHLAEAWDAIGRKRLRAVFLVGAAMACLYGGSKSFTGTVTFPRTDPETWYLMDLGSYVTNGAVVVKFAKNIVVPSSAMIFVDGCDHSLTNADRWLTHGFTAYSNTIAQAGTEFEVPYPAATNFDWLVYTNWTPPPVVHTNGVAFVAWQIGVGKATNDLAMTRTGVYLLGERLAPSPAITNSPAFPITINLGEQNDEE